MTILLLMNFIVGTSAFLLNYKFFKFPGLLDSILSYCIIYLAQIIFTETLLGVFGALRLSHLFLFNLSLLLGVLFLTSKKGAVFPLASLRPALRDLLKNKTQLFGASLILGFGIVKVCINLINPPFGWDCLNYHFSFPVEWLKHANLDTAITVADDPSPSYYPINGSLLFFWLMAPLRNVFLADLGQVPFFILSFLASFSISRKIGLGRELSFYSGALLMLTPNFFKQLEIAYVDVMLVALFLTALNFLLALFRDFSTRNIILWSSSFGIFLGTKTSAAVYGIFALAFFCWLNFYQPKKRGLRKILIYSGIFCLLTAVLGGFAYVRNFIQAGNPLFPADIRLFGQRIFKGVMPLLTYRARWGREDFNFEKFLFHEGLGGQFMVFALPALVISIPLLFIKGRKNINPVLIFAHTLPLLLLLSFWFFMPQFWVRYLYPFLGIIFIIAMYAVMQLNIPKAVLRPLILICLFASGIELSGHWELLGSLALSAIFFVSLPLILKLKAGLSLWAAMSLFIVTALYFLNGNYNRHEFRRYLKYAPYPFEERQAWNWLNDNTKGERVAYTGRPQPFPLYGTNFKNDIFYVSVNSVHPTKLHYFPKGSYVWGRDFMALHQNLMLPGNYRENADYPIWMRNLRLENTDYLFVYSLHQVEPVRFPIEDGWARGHPESFKQAFSNESVHIYKIIK